MELDRVIETAGGLTIAFGIGLALGPAVGIVAFGAFLVVLSLTL